jgi:hypothetical protein
MRFPPRIVGRLMIVLRLDTPHQKINTDNEVLYSRWAISSFAVEWPQGSQTGFICDP